jgi:hypothetical protein
MSCPYFEKKKKKDQNIELKEELTAPPVIVVQHEWIEVVEHDIEAGLSVMFAVTLLAVFASLFTLCSRNDTTVDATAVRAQAQQFSPSPSSPQVGEQHQAGRRRGGTYGGNQVDKLK